VAPAYRYAASMTELPGQSVPVGESAAFEDEDYRRAVVDLLGAIAYGELAAFDRLSADARLAPSLGDKIAMSQMACVELGHLVQLRDRITELGADPSEAMAPFTRALDMFHTHTAPSPRNTTVLAEPIPRRIASLRNRGPKSSEDTMAAR